MANLKKSLVLALLVMFVLGFYGYFRSIPGVKNQTEGLPKIEVTPDSFDFGQVKYGQVLEHRFKVKNQGKEVLEIKRLSTSCGCTTAQISRFQLKPGEEEELLVRYETAAMSGSHAKGRQERIIYLKTNDPQNPQKEVMIFANVL